MPVYDFYCDKCRSVEEIKLSLSQHSEEKDKQKCKKCGATLIQKVAPLRFKLEGGGWFDQDYGITQHEMDVNLDGEKMIEDVAKNYMEKDKSEAREG